MVSIEEIDNWIAELHLQGKGTREISAAVRKNFAYVGAHLKILFPEEFGNAAMPTKETQALRAFHAKKFPTETAIELGLTTDETEKFSIRTSLPQPQILNGTWQLPLLHNVG